MPQRDSTTGETVGPFEVLDLLGQGAMGRVCRARQTNLNRLVALKLLDDRLARDRGQVERFLREARAAASIRHPNVAGLIDVGTCPTTGKHFIAFELVDGPSVAELLRARGRLPEREALTICLGMAEAITSLEQHNLVHRDLQPSNILIADDGTPKMIDLGLAKRLDETGSITVGAFLSTPHYVAPEQAMAVEKIDSRADLYALGITLYQCVTGELPFEGDDFLSVVTRHVNEDVPDPRQRAPEVSEATSRLVAGLCARNRDQRYTPRAAVLDFRRVLDGEPPLGPDAAAAAVAAGELRPRGAVARVPRGKAAAVQEAAPPPEVRAAGTSHTDLLGGIPFKLILTGPEGVTEHEFDQPVVTIGREPRCDLVINDKTVSRRHASLLRNGPTFALSAHQTANGTFLNGRPVSELAVVTPSDEVRIAEKFTLRLVPLSRARKAPDDPSAPASREATAQAGAAPGSEEKTSEIEVTAGAVAAPAARDLLGDFDPYAADPPRVDVSPPRAEPARSPAPLSGLGAPGLPPPRRVEPRRSEATSASDRLRRLAASAPARDDATARSVRRSSLLPPPQEEIEDTDTLRKPVEPPPPPVPPAGAPAGGRTCVVVFSKGPDEHRVEVTGAFKLGKGPECDLPLKHPHAPRKAALIVRGLNGCTLYNVAPSPNTVTVNGKPIPDEVLLSDGDQISVYGATLTYEER